MTRSRTIPAVLLAFTLVGCEAAEEFSGLSRECRAQVADFSGYANCMSMRTMATEQCIANQDYCRYIIGNIELAHAGVASGQITPRQGVEHVESVVSSTASHIDDANFRRGMAGANQYMLQQQMLNLQQQQIQSLQPPRMRNCFMSPDRIGGWQSTCF